MSNTEDGKERVKPRLSTTSIRVNKNTARKVRTLVNRLNKKTLGRKLKFDDYLEKVFDLMGDDILKEIQESSLTNSDKLELSFKDYCRNHGIISKDEYLGMLLSQKS